ncbi:MAG: septum formation initiator family protein [Acidimicrobiales bacterium]
MNRDRNRWVLPLAVLTAIVMLVGWFPLTSIWHQQSELNTTLAQLNAINNQQHALTLQAKSLDSKAAARLLAREQYQLVSPGQSLIQVLPGDGSGNISQSAGDPGLQPLVAPSSVSSLVATTPTTTLHHSPTHAFVSRLIRTLEFWR